jgi:hypothetical protein
MSKPRGVCYCGTKLRRNLFTGGVASGMRGGLSLPRRRLSGTWEPETPNRATAPDRSALIQRPRLSPSTLVANRGFSKGQDRNGCCDDDEEESNFDRERDVRIPVVASLVLALNAFAIPHTVCKQANWKLCGPEVGFGEIAIHLLQARFWATNGMVRRLYPASNWV